MNVTAEEGPVCYELEGPEIDMYRNKRILLHYSTSRNLHVYSYYCFAGLLLFFEHINKKCL